VEESFDYVIVGAGSAGCVLAKRLTENGQHRVCLLEAGPPDRNPFLHIPAGFMRTLVDPKVNWLYQTEPGEGTAGRSIAQPRGKTLGGSSAINGHIYNRGQRLDYDVWAQRGNRGWSYAEVLPYFKRHERRIGAADPRFRGREGEFVVEDLDYQHPLCDAFIRGATELGIPRNPDYNGASQEGVGFFQRAIHKGRRMSSARAFLGPSRDRSNLAIRTGAHALAIELDGTRATGVRYTRGGQEQLVRAGAEVILCGGTFNSPQLLQLSGVGEPEFLRSRGIAVQHALPGVGENLRDHFGVRMVARVKGVETINERSRGLKLVQEVGKYLTQRKGLLTLQPTLVHVFWRSRPEVDVCDLQLTFTPASYEQGVQSKLDTFPGFTVAVWQQRPESTGYVRVASPDPFARPVIQPNYLDDPIDRGVLLDGLKLARRLMHSQALRPYVDAEHSPGERVVDDDALMRYARERGTTTFHPIGSCRMGPGSDPRAVVDEQLRVHGLHGLRVVDASIMPTMPSANTNAATLMIADKASDMILGRKPLPAAEV
jgi:choline dehydrogenase